MKTMNREKKRITQYLAIGLALFVILGAGTYAVYSWNAYTGGLSGSQREFERRFSSREGSPSEGDRNVSREDRRRFFEQMADELGLTPEQKEELAKLREQGFPRTPEEREKRMAKLEQILTPEQMQGFRNRIGSRIERIMQRRLARAKRVLPPDQYKLYEERWNQRIQEFRNRGGFRGRRGGTPQNQGGESRR